MRNLIIAAILALGLGTVGAIYALPTDSDHAKATTPEMLAAYADPPGSGMLDGLRFDTTMGLQGKPPDIEDFVQFDHGLFMSRECTDRCNYPPSAYFARNRDDRIEFIVEAFCPTKDTTMVWRGDITNGAVSGTVTWTTNRLYWRRSTVLEFNGAVSELSAAIDIE